MTGAQDFRSEVRSFMEANWNTERYADDLAAAGAGGYPVGAWHRKLAEARLTAPHYPEQYGGRGVGLAHRAIFQQELARVGALGPGNAIGIGWAGGTILHFGSKEQRERYLLPIVNGDEIWCQLFSEPDAGSDLAALSTSATKDGDEWVINGQKVWTSYAAEADWGILLARTDPSAPKHNGISYFLLDMRRPGVEVRPIRQMTGFSRFNEVFLTDARTSELVGEVNKGWALAVATLASERIDLSTSPGLLWGAGPTFAHVWHQLAVEPASALARERVTRLYIDHFVLALMKDRTLRAASGDSGIGKEIAIQKLLSDVFGQQAMQAVIDGKAAEGMVVDESWTTSFLYSRALTIGGGTVEVQKNIIGERVLGLPTG